jgi:hypothetical protein
LANELASGKRPEEAAHIPGIKFKSRAEGAGGDVGPSSDLIKNASFGERVFTVEVPFSKQTESGCIEAIELTESRDLIGDAGIGSHRSRIIR